MHITSSLWVLAAGLAQFFPRLLRSRPGLHRRLGKLYVISILALAAPSGLILAGFANGGLVAKVGFALQCVVGGLSTWQAYRRARQRRWEPHTEWMMRSFAVTLAAMSLRTMQGPLNGFLGTDHYRVKIMLTSVVRAPGNPGLYRVKGKSRFKKTIIPLTGYFTLTSVVKQPSPSADKQRKSVSSGSLRGYSALGSFLLKEDSLTWGRVFCAATWRWILGSGAMKHCSLIPITPSLHPAKAASCWKVPGPAM